MLEGKGGNGEVVRLRMKRETCTRGPFIAREGGGSSSRAQCARRVVARWAVGHKWRRA